MKVKATIVQTHRAYSLHLEMWKIKDLLSVWLLTFPFSEAPNKVPSANEYRFWLLDYTDYFLSSSSPLNNCCLWNPLCKKQMTLQHSYSSFVFNIRASLWLHTMWGELQVRAGRWELKTQGYWSDTEYTEEKKGLKVNIIFLYPVLLQFQKPRNRWLCTGQDTNQGTTEN